MRNIFILCKKHRNGGVRGAWSLLQLYQPGGGVAGHSLNSSTAKHYFLAKYTAPDGTELLCNQGDECKSIDKTATAIAATIVNVK